MVKTILKIIILTMLPTLAFGHSPIKSVDPIDKAVLTEAPTEDKMIFKLSSMYVVANFRYPFAGFVFERSCCQLTCGCSLWKYFVTLLVALLSL